MKPIEPPIHIEGFKNVVYGENQPGYIPLPTLRSHAPDGRVISVWKFDWRERIKILFGQPLYLSILTFHHPLQPLLLVVGDDSLVNKETNETSVLNSR